MEGCEQSRNSMKDKSYLKTSLPGQLHLVWQSNYPKLSSIWSQDFEQQPEKNTENKHHAGHDKKAVR